MSILSQIGIVVLIGCIIFILIRSNKTLEEASKEGEQFVDEWDLRQQRKAERLLERQEEKQKKQEEREEKQRQKQILKQRQTERIEEEPEWEQPEEASWEDEQPEEEKETWNSLKIDIPEKEYNDGKIVSMDQYKNSEITLIQMDEGHRPVRRVRVTQLPFTIGRSKENMLVLDDLCVARKHCRIVPEDGCFVLEDVGTANKLFVNGKVTDRVILDDQLVLYIGNVEFKVEMGIAKSRRTSLYRQTGEKYYE